MNSKSEWNNARIPRIVIETGEELVEDQESGLGRKCENVKKRGPERGRVPLTVERNEKKRGETKMDEEGKLENGCKKR